MGRYIDKEHSFAIYNAPKGGGTTIRSWIYFAKTGELALKDEGDGYINQTKKTYQLLREIGYEVCNFIPWLDGPSICIVRDPVDRFMSIYKDKIQKEKKCGNPPPTISEFVRDFENLVKANDHPHGANPNLNYLDHHFAPQSLIFGTNEDYFEHIFQMNEINTKLKSYLEDRWRLQLPDLHCRKSAKTNKSTLNEEDLYIIKDFYRSDFACDWISRRNP